MRMTSQDEVIFYHSLNLLGTFFTDELTETRQRLYWQVMKDNCTIEEWQQACYGVMEHEAFHKVPLPAILLRYVATYRDEYRKRDAVRAFDADYRAKTQKALLAGPMPPDYVKNQIQALLDQVAEGVPIPAPPRDKRIPEYRTPLEEWEYADRKARLLRQARKIQDEQKEP
jgi:hypothetical protein